jgi:IS5 family transposase
MERLLAETTAAAQRQPALKPTELRRVNVDTTVQEKAIAFPTDARLYHKARCVLVREAQRAGLELRLETWLFQVSPNRDISRSLARVL